MRRVPLGAFLRLELNQIEVDPFATYPIAGVYGFGRGLFARESVLGSQISYRKLTRLSAGSFVFSRLKAFEGAVAIVPQEFDGYFVSQEFPTFAVDGSVALLAYLGFVNRWPEFWRMLAASSKGVGARRERVHPEQLLAVEIPLPDLDAQHGTVARLGAALGQAKAIDRMLGAGDPARLVSVYPGMVEHKLARETAEWKPVGEFVDFVNDLVRPGESTEPAEAFVGLQHIESHTGRRIGSVPLGGEKGRKFRFEPGDVVYGYLRPYLNKVWVADMHGLCSVDQYVLRPRHGLRAAYLAHALRSRATLEQATALTHNLQLPRLRSGLLAGIEIPVVPPERLLGVTKALDRGLERIVEARVLRSRQVALLDGLTKSVLNSAFAGLL